MVDEIHVLRAKRDQLDQEMKRLRALPEYQKELQLCQKFAALAIDSGFSPERAIEILASAYPHLGSGVVESIEVAPQARPHQKTYKHPETGELLNVNEGRSKLLRMWREAYGREVVEQWVIEG